MLVDLCKVYATTVGVGPITLGAAVPAFRGVEALTDNTSYHYSIQTGSNYEYGTCTYFVADNSLSRGVIGSSNGNSAINLPPNAVVTFCALASDYAGSVGAPIPVIVNVNPAYTLQSADGSTYQLMTSAAPVTVQIPNDGTFLPVDTVIAFEQNGAGTVSFTTALGATLNSRGPLKTTAGQYAVAQIKKVGPNTWTLLGDIA